MRSSRITALGATLLATAFIAGACGKSSGGSGATPTGGGTTSSPRGTLTVGVGVVTVGMVVVTVGTVAVTVGTLTVGTLTVGNEVVRLVSTVGSCACALAGGNASSVTAATSTAPWSACLRCRGGTR